MRTRLLTALGVIGLCSSTVCDAQAQSPAKGAAAHAAVLTHGARALIDKAIAALDAHDLPTATRLLTDAYRQSLRSEVLYQLGRLAVAEGRTLDAYDLMRRYLADPSREVNEAATHAAEELVSQPPPPSGSLSVLSDAGALVLVDKRVVATLPLLLPLLVAPGAHTVQLEFPGKKLEAPVDVQLGRLSEVRLIRSSGAVLVSVLPAILFCPTPTDLPADASRTLVDTVEQAARDEQYTVLRGDLLLPKGPEYQRCLQTKGCVQDLAGKNNIELVLEQDVQVRGDKQSPTWQFRLRLFRLPLVEPAATSEKSCTACPKAQAVTVLKEAAAKVLADGLIRPHGTLNITTAPAAASVRIGSGEAQRAPYHTGAWVGSYEVTATHPGYQKELRTVEVPDGKLAELHIELQKDVSQVTPPAKESYHPRGDRAPRPRWRLGVGGSLIGIGLGMTVVGGLGLSFSGSCIDTPDLTNGTCQRLYDTTAVGGFTLGSGLILIGSGVLLMALPGPLK